MRRLVLTYLEPQSKVLKLCQSERTSQRRSADSASTGSYPVWPPGPVAWCSSAAGLRAVRASPSKDAGHACRSVPSAPAG